MTILITHQQTRKTMSAVDGFPEPLRTAAMMCVNPQRAKNIDTICARSVPNAITSG